MTAPIRELIEQFAESEGNARVRAAQVLAEAADPRAADVLIQASYDNNEEVRAHAAHGLALIQHPLALDTLIRTFDDFPDVLHNPFTLSAYGLIGIGARALPAVVPLLKSRQPMTRERALAVVQAIVSALPEGGDWDDLWMALGRYDPNADPVDRDRAADLWIGWASARRKG